MKESQLMAISPVDGRYYEKTEELRDIFSEYGLMKRRVLVEIKWLQALSACDSVPEVPDFSSSIMSRLNNIISNFSLADAEHIKAFEKTTNHDVKAVEYFVKDRIGYILPPENVEFVHFGCTSEDINNIAYALMLNDAISILLTKLTKTRNVLHEFGSVWKDIPMIARTHGQLASPTTLGKEMYVYYDRIYKQLKHLSNIGKEAKINGATGNYNAHVVAYPDVNWISLSKRFVESLGLVWNSHTTQIEPHDYMAEIFDNCVRINTILTDLCRDMWGYISLGYLQQKKVETETGSSTMPHKVNPIDFENAEGNLGMANAILSHLSRTLPISRWQRDLTDSTLQRNIGVGLSHCLIGYLSLQRGLQKVTVNKHEIEDDLNDSWEVLGEAIQTVMKRHGITNAYEQLKDFTRGESISQASLQQFIVKLDIPDEDKTRLIQLHPTGYIGKASQLAEGL